MKLSQCAIETKWKQIFQDIFLIQFPFFNNLGLVLKNNLAVFYVSSCKC